MKQREPLVSVFMPAYNQQEFVAAAMDSVLEQHYPNLELIVGDDCSTDATWSIVEDYQRRFPERMRSFRNAQNLGITGNCNAVLARCRGTYIGFHAGDDLWLPDKVSRQVAVLEAHPDCPLCYHDVDVFDSASDETLYLWNTGARRPAALEAQAPRFLAALVANNAGFMAALSVMVRRSCLPDDARYDARLPHISELSMWLQVLSGETGVVRFVPEVLARYRKHPGGISLNDNEVEFDTFLAIVENEHPELVDAVRQARGRRYYTRGVNSVLRGEHLQARRYLRAGLRNHIYSPKLFYWLARAILRR